MPEDGDVLVRELENITLEGVPACLDILGRINTLRHDANTLLAGWLSQPEGERSHTQRDELHAVTEEMSHLTTLFTNSGCSTVLDLFKHLMMFRLEEEEGGLEK